MTTATGSAAHASLGEELPLFCERCGYSLTGLPQVRCPSCQLLQFHCPECGHHQPINTLRPAAQRILGRARAWILALSVFLKLFVLFWPLFGWVGMGIEWSYDRQYTQTQTPGASRNYHDRVRPVDLEETVAFLLFGLGFGMFARMLLLRWRRGYLVGICLAALMFAAVTLGIWIQRVDRDITIGWPVSPPFLLLLAMTVLVVIIGASIVWPIWSMLVHVFLPRETATKVLAWQSFRCERTHALARD
jgi:hypothetical protein